MVVFILSTCVEPKIDQWNGPPAASADGRGGYDGGENRDDYSYHHSSSHRGGRSM